MELELIDKDLLVAQDHQLLEDQEEAEDKWNKDLNIKGLINLFLSLQKNQTFLHPFYILSKLVYNKLHNLQFILALYIAFQRSCLFVQNNTDIEKSIHFHLTY